MTQNEIEVRESLHIVDTCITKRNYIKENLMMYGENTTLKEIIDELDRQIEKYNGIVDNVFEKWEPKLNDCSYPYDDNMNTIVSPDGSLKILYHAFTRNDTDPTYPFKWDKLLLESVQCPKNPDKNQYIDIYGYGIADWDWQKPFSAILFDDDSALMIFKGCTVVDVVTGEKGTAQRPDKVTIRVTEMEIF